jgi:glycosyltransferase involved in cell wall biosynthesis
MKNVLVVSQVIPQWYIDTLRNALGEESHIDVITGSDVTGVNVIPSPRHDARSFKSRLICWVKHYRFIKKWMNSNKHTHYDLIFAVSNPPINAAIGLKLKKLFDAPFVYMNWDLYPQVIEYGVRNVVGKTVSRLWHRWNNRNYPKIDRMLTIGNVMAETINNSLERKIKIDVLPVAVDTVRLRPIEKANNPFAVEHHLTDKFVVLYSGKMGVGHNIELILAASQQLKQYSEIKFVFIGNGPKYEVVKRFMAENNSPNILLLPLQQEEMFPFSIACGDIGIVSQEASMAHLFMPSKTYSMMACGEAIIGIGSEHDDLKCLIERTNVGFNISRKDVRYLANCILKLYDNCEMLNSFKSNARRIAESEYSISVMQSRYSKLFNRLLI